MKHFKLLIIVFFVGILFFNTVTLAKTFRQELLEILSGQELNLGNAGIIDWVYNRNYKLLYSNPNINQILIGGTATTSYSSLEVQGGLTIDSATTTDTLYVGGYASTTGGLFTQGSGHYGGSLTIDGNSTTTFAYFTNPPTISENRVYDNQHQLADLFYVDLAVSALGARYYMYDTASGIEDYKLTSITASADPEESDAHAEVVTNEYLRGWISPTAGAPSKMIAGVYEWHIFSQQSGGTGKKDLRLYWTLVERKADTTEVVIATSSMSNLISNLKVDNTVSLALSTDYEIASDSYVLGKIYADVSGSGGDPSVTLYYEGDSDSHWEIPTNLEILSDQFVPFTGADKNVDLGVYELFSLAGRFTSLNATTTNIDNLFVYNNATVTNHFEADSMLYAKDGRVGIGTDPSALYASFGIPFKFSNYSTWDVTSGAVIGNLNYASFAPTSDSSAVNFGIYNSISTDGAFNQEFLVGLQHSTVQNGTGRLATLAGAILNAEISNFSNVTSTTVLSANFLNGAADVDGGGNVDSAYGIDIGISLGTQAGYLTDWKGLRVDTPSITGGSLTNNYAIYVEDQSGATNNYAIYTNAGDVRLGDDVIIVGNATSSKSIDASAFCISGANCISAWPSGGASSWDDLTNKPATSTILALLDSDYRIANLNATSTLIDNAIITGSLNITGNAFSLGDGSAGDPVITFNSGNDGTITWEEDGQDFEMSGDLEVANDIYLSGGDLFIVDATAPELKFNSSAGVTVGQIQYLNAASTISYYIGGTGAANKIASLTATGFQIGGGGAVDYTLSFNADVNDGVIQWMTDEDYFITPDEFRFSDDILVSNNATVTNHFAADATLYVKDSRVGINTLTPETLFDVNGTAWFNKISASSTPGFIDFKFIDGKSGTTTDTISYRTVGINTSGYEDYHVFYGYKSNYATWGGVMPRTYSSTTDMFCDFAYTATSTSVVYPFKIYIKTLDDNENPELPGGFDLNNAVSITSPGTAGLVDYVSIPVTTTDYLAPGDIFRIKLEVTGVDTRGQVSFLNNLHCWWR